MQPLEVAIAARRYRYPFPRQQVLSFLRPVKRLGLISKTIWVDARQRLIRY